MTDLIAFDSAYPKAIPDDAAAIFPYADGRFKWSNIEFPHASYRYITTHGDPTADIADYEEGCIFGEPALTAWAIRRLALNSKHDLTVYTDRYNFPAVAHAMIGMTWHLFLTTLDGTKPVEYAGKPCRAVQYTDRSGMYDESVVYERAWLNPPDAG
jgi:hypothetical protein